MKQNSTSISCEINSIQFLINFTQKIRGDENNLRREINSKKVKERKLLYWETIPEEFSKEV